MSRSGHPSSSRSSSSSSSRSAGGSRRDHEVSVNIYSPGNGYWASFIRKERADSGHLYHVRKFEQAPESYFYYQDRPQDTVSPSLFGRSIVGRLSSGERDRAHTAIARYGGDDANIPRPYRGENCQDFTTGTLRALESERLIRPGHSDYFAQRRGRDGFDIAADLHRDGRSWIPAPERRLIADARFRDDRGLGPTGRLDIGRYEGLLRAPRRDLTTSSSGSTSLGSFSRSRSRSYTRD